MNGPVVVGVDGTSWNLVTVEAAAKEAQRRGVGLRLAHAIGWSSDHVRPGVPPWDPDGSGLGASVNGTLAVAEHRAHEAAPGVEVTGEVLVGEPAAVLAIESRSASLAVVGRHGPAGPLGRMQGSVAGYLAAHGDCPVLVVRGRPAPVGAVVVGVDGSQAVGEAVAFAFSEAALRGVDLVVLNMSGTRIRRSHDGSGEAPVDGDRARDGGTRVLDGLLSDLMKKYPEVPVHHRSAGARTGSALVGASAGAQLVVVGARERRRARAALPGSADRAALRHAQCPVAVVGLRKP
jgi:nucleotide-binding universal stress UspA family protein